MNICIVQARMGSTRLPGKVLMNVNGKPLLLTMIERINPAKSIDKLIVATTTNPEDDELFEFCTKANIQCYRGSDWDVLDRFYQAIIDNVDSNPNTVIRICADNALHSHKVVDFVVSEFERSGKEYFSNSNQEPDYLEDGFDVEVFSFKSLEKAWKEATMLSEREHVCPYIKKHFSCGWKKANDDYQFKLSIDTEQDLNAVRKIYEELKDVPDFGIDEVVNLLRIKPEILEINKDSVINAGFHKSLNEDKKVN